MKKWLGTLAGSLVIALTGLTAAHAQSAAKPQVVRIGFATPGVGNDPVRTGGYNLALAYTDGSLEADLAKDGIRVEYKFFKGAGPAVNEALANKQLDFALQGDLPSLLHRASGIKTKIVLGSNVRANVYLAVPPGSDIQRIEDLKGKRVAVFKGTNLHLVVVRALAARGLKENDVKLINMETASSTAALINKDVDAAFGWVNLFGPHSKGQARIIWRSSDDSLKFTRQAALLVTEEFAQQYPKVVQQVVKSVVKSSRQYSDESRRAELFALWGKAEFPDGVWREDSLGKPLKAILSPLLDPFLVARYKDAVDEAFDLKLIRSKVEIDSWFDRRYLNAALKELNQESYWPAYGADGRLLSN